MTTDEFIEKARKVHGDRYDYSKVVYVRSNQHVCIICPEHGEFWQSPNSHLSGRGCSKCAHEKIGRIFAVTTEEFIRRARAKHGDKYSYDKTVYKTNKKKVIVTCPIHGDVKVYPNKHLEGCGCPKCRYVKAAQSNTLTTEEFIERARKVHGDRYDYSRVVYQGYEIPVEIICPIHGSFMQSPDSHLHCNGCQSCGNGMSTGERDIYEYIISLGEEVIMRDRKILKGCELDIVIPSHKLAIEYDGLRWHSDQFHHDNTYHIEKTRKCNDMGYRLIHVFEDEYIYRKNIVFAKLRHILGYTDKRIYARKCTVREICVNDARQFLENNHIQGFARSTYHIGCFYEDRLIGVMSFLKYKDNLYELVRFATDNNYSCIGVGGKLFSYFVKKYNPSAIKTFADLRWTVNTDENLYTKLGFRYEYATSPNYTYVVKDRRVHKFNFRKQILHKKYGLPMTMTETEMTRELGYYRIYDCGLLKYVWKNDYR